MVLFSSFLMFMDAKQNVFSYSYADNVIDNELYEDNHFKESIDFNMDTLNRFNMATINALGIESEFLLKLKTQNKLIVADTKKWEYVFNKFENKNTIITVLRKMLGHAEIPQEFLFLAMAESEFNLKAYSNKKASGIWQIIPSTARSLGLIINEYIDERKDPIKSTKAAIRYLQYLYESNNNKWYLAAMAYNCGPGCVRRAIKEANSDDIEVLLDEDKKYLPLETREYIKKIISLSIAFSNVYDITQKNKHHLLNRGANDSIVSVSVNAGNTLEYIAKSANMKLNDLKMLNHQFKYNFVPPGRGKYEIYLPYEKLSYFKQNFKEDPSKIKNFMIHYVKKGETLDRIARLYNTNVKKIRELNNIKGSMIKINQKITLPFNIKVANNDKKKKN